MTDLAKLDDRVTKLEREMPEVRKLASGASSEASDVHVRLRAHTKSLEALRKTQVEQGKEIRELRTEMREGFAHLRQEFGRLAGEMRHGFSLMAVGMAQINARLAIAIGESEEVEES